MIASPCRISPSSTVSELHCPWYGHNAFGTSLISSGYPAIIMSVRVLSNVSSWIASFFCFFLKFLEDMSPFRGATDTPVLDFW